MKQINKLLRWLHQKVISNRRNHENQVLIKFFSQYVKPDASILDIGCGLGHNLTLLKNNGYVNAVGTDISEEMLAASKERGHVTYTQEDLKEHRNHFDVLLFSHVLEHIEYRDIQKILESYFELTKPDALVIVCMPLLYDGFYHDVDHIKPYYAKGLTALFSDISIPKQYASRFCLNLIDLRYLRASLVPYHLRSRHIRNIANYMVLGGLTFFFMLLRVMTFGLASKVISYIAVFKLEDPLRGDTKK